MFDCNSLSKLIEVKSAHSFFVTGITFTTDSKAIVSVSADSSSLITPIEIKKSSGIYSYLSFNEEDYIFFAGVGVVVAILILVFAFLVSFFFGLIQ